MLWFFIVVLLNPTCNGYKFLVVSPKHGYSHINFMGKIADALVDAGHDVVTFQPLINDKLASNGTMKSRLIQTKLIEETLPEMSLLNNPDTQRPMWRSSATSPMGILRFLPLVNSMTAKVVANILEDKELIQQLKAEKFDLVITELYDFIGITFAEALGIKNIVGAHSNGCLLEGTAMAIGLPLIPSFVPASLGVTDDSSSFTTRLINIVFVVLSWYQQIVLSGTAEKVMMEKLGSAATPIWHTLYGMNWVISNSDPLLDFPKPITQNVVEIGGIGVPEKKQLTEEWNTVLNLRSKTVLISFGSVTPSIFMPDEMKASIVDVVTTHPDVTFIWKYEDPTDPLVSGIENLVVSSWTPQNDLLADDRLTLFITHGGSGSMMESATHGKPMIVVPLFGDQMRNARIVEKFGFAVILDKSQLTECRILNEAVDKVLNTKKYTEAAKRIRGILSHRVIKPKEKLVKTMEMAAKFGKMPELLVSGRNLNFIVYYNLDIVLFSILLICTAVSLLGYILIRVVQFLLRRTEVKVKTH